MPLEKAMTYIQDDELVEITPKSIRLRKRYLDPTSVSAWNGQRQWTTRTPEYIRARILYIRVNPIFRPLIDSD